MIAIAVAGASLAVAAHSKTHAETPASPAMAAHSQRGTSTPVTHPRPSVYVVHTVQTQDNAPGAIEVIDVATGKVLRKLGATYDPYPLNGFRVSADSSTLYYTRLNEAKQRIEVAAVAVAGGPTTLVAADGIDPSPAPDGHALAYLTAASTAAPRLAVLNLTTRRVLMDAIPRPSGVADVDSVTWLGDSRRILVVTGGPPAQCDGPPGAGPCTVAGATDSTYRAWVYTIDGNGWTQVPAVASTQIAWSSVDVIGADASSVISTRYNAATDNDSVYRIQLTTGDVTVIGETPQGSTIQAVDVRGLDYLLNGRDGTQSWRPGLPAQRLGPAEAEVTW